LLEYEAIVRRIVADGPCRILDWGCGWGQVSDMLHAAGLTVDSFDYRGPESPDALKELPRFAGSGDPGCQPRTRPPSVAQPTRREHRVGRRSHAPWATLAYELLTRRYSLEPWRRL
jgi:hypothetical protein